jgi:NitT/TauT family transport system permease protein
MVKTPTSLPDQPTTDVADPPIARTVDTPANQVRAKLAQSRLSQPVAISLQILLAAVLLAAWQWIPSIPGAQNQVKWLNAFYISSPLRVCHELYNLFTGAHREIVIWPYFASTLEATIIGFGIGLLSGGGLGLLLSNAPRARQIVNPFVILFNSMPRIALIPILVIIAGPNKVATTVNAALVVFVVVFFNALEGGKNVPSETIANAALLGASNMQLMRFVRLPVVIMWTFAALPNAISFALLTVVTTEVLTGINGLGSLILSALTNVNANLAMAIVILLGALGLLLNGFAVLVKARVLRWQPRTG